MPCHSKTIESSVHERMSNIFFICVLLTQFGKTFNAIERIKFDMLNQPDSLAVILTMNTILANKQFASRLETFCNDNGGPDSVVVFNSDKKYKGPFKHVSKLGELVFEVLRVRPKIIVMCSNKIRFADVVEFLKIIDEPHSSGGIKNAFLYFDELHAYLNWELRAQIEEISQLQIVKRIIGLTATPDAIFAAVKGWDRINLIYQEGDFDISTYVGISDMAFKIVNDFERFASPYKAPGCMDHDTKLIETIGFARHVLDKNPYILAPKNRVFCPAHVSCQSHAEMRDLLFEKNKNIVVVLIAGGVWKSGEQITGKTIQYYETPESETPTTVPISSQDNEEFSQTLPRMINERSLNERCIVITGHICIGMGQTFTSPEFGSFTHAIIGHMDLNNDAIYQLFGRLTGRMKPHATKNPKWTKPYIHTQVFCTEVVMERVQIMEQCTKKLCEKASSDESATCTQSEYRDNEGPDISGNYTKPKKQKKVKKIPDEYVYEKIPDCENEWFSNEEDPHEIKTNKKHSKHKIFKNMAGTTRKWQMAHNVWCAQDGHLRRINDPVPKPSQRNHTAKDGSYRMLVQNEDCTAWTIVICKKKEQ